MSSEDAATLQAIRRAIDALPAADHARTMRVYNIVRNIVSQNGEFGVYAMSLLGAEIAAIE